LAVIHEINRALEPIRGFIQSLITRVVVTRVDESKKLRTAQFTGRRGATTQAAEMFSHYGFASHPIPDSCEGISISCGGVDDHQVLIATADRTVKITLAQGEVAIHDDLGQKVHLARAGIVIDTPGDVTVNAGGDAVVHADVDASVTADGSVAVTANGGNVQLNASGLVNLGGAGGPAVARIGDAVSGGATITGGSSKVFAN